MWAFTLGRWKFFGTRQGWWLHNIINVLKATDLFPLKLIIWCYVNFTPIIILKKPLRTKAWRPYDSNLVNYSLLHTKGHTAFCQPSNRYREQAQNHRNSASPGKQVTYTLVVLPLHILHIAIVSLFAIWNFGGKSNNYSVTTFLILQVRRLRIKFKIFDLQCKHRKLRYHRSTL